MVYKVATFNYQGFTIHYTIEGEGKTIVLLHGLGGSSMNWIYQRNSLKADYQVISVDLPGHGKSEGADDLTFFDYHQLLRELLLEELGLRDLVLCGLSMGGKAAIDFSCRYPEAVRGLVVADTFASMQKEDKKKRKELWDLVHQPGGVDLWLERVIQQMGLDPDGSIAKGFRKGIETQSPVFLYGLFTQLMDYDQDDQLEVIQVPSMVLHGEHDEFAPRSCAEELHRGLANSELCIVPDCGHLPNVEQPQVFNELLAKFMKRV